MENPHENTLFRTTGDELAPTVTRDGEFVENQCAELMLYYDQLLREARFSWTTHLRLMRRLGGRGTRRRLSDRTARFGRVHPARRFENLLA